MGNSHSHTKHPLAGQGTVQSGRLPYWLEPGRVMPDDRDTGQLLQYLREIAKEVRFFDHQEIKKDAEGNFTSDLRWAPLLEKLTAENLAQWRKEGTTPPHLAMLAALVRLYQFPQQLLNDNVRRHLHFYYGDVLGIPHAGAMPDTVHPVFALKKNAPLTLLKAGTGLGGAKDAAGKPLRYALEHDCIISAARVEKISGICLRPENPDQLQFAPVANSADGLGAALPASDARWNAFGSTEWPQATVGFALASPVLRMQEGQRTITLLMELSGLKTGLTGKDFQNTFSIAFTGAKGWISKGNVSFELVGQDATVAGANTLRFSVTFDEKDPAVVDYQEALHGSRYLHAMPVMQLVLNAGSPASGYQGWKRVQLTHATLSVDVKGITTLEIVTDYGSAEAKKPFFPFGPTGDRNAACRLDYPEAFGKVLKELRLNLTWKNIPSANLGTYFEGYPGISSNSSFKVYASFADGGSWQHAGSENLFDENNATADHSLVFRNPDFKILPLLAERWFLPVKPAFTLSPGEPLVQKMFSIQQYGPAPMHITRVNVLDSVKAIRLILLAFSPKPSKAPGLTLQLLRGFPFKDYRQKLASTVANFSKQPEGSTISLPKEPFAPELKSLTMDYAATTGRVALGGSGIFPVLGQALHHYHVGPFGVRHEEPRMRAHLWFIRRPGNSLLPAFDFAGACYIGLANTSALNEVTLLFQVAEGSANPDKRRPALSWHVLANNYWKPLGARELIFDSSEGLTTSGVVKLVLPAETTTVNTWMDDGLVWLRMSVAQDPDAVCQVVDIRTNAAIARLQGNGYHTAHFGQALPAGSITRLEEPLAAIQSVSQPYPSAKGQPAESDDAWYTRVSERLRHKQRSITPNDAERGILQAFPHLYQVKAIPHSGGDSVARAGHCTLVLVPSLLQAYDPDPLRPKADVYTREKVVEWVEAHSSAWAAFEVTNPRYCALRVQAGIRLHAGYAFGFYKQEIEAALKRMLAPWTSGAPSAFRFGGRISVAQVTHFLENLPWVDYVSGVKLFEVPDNGDPARAVTELEITHPAGVLTSAETHLLSAI